MSSGLDSARSSIEVPPSGQATITGPLSRNNNNNKNNNGKCGRTKTSNFTKNKTRWNKQIQHIYWKCNNNKKHSRDQKSKPVQGQEIICRETQETETDKKTEIQTKIYRDRHSGKGKLCEEPRLLLKARMQTLWSELLLCYFWIPVPPTRTPPS